MGPDLGTPATTTRCPQCNAALRPDAQWCSLCHHDLRPPAPEPTPVAEPFTSGYGGPDPLTAPLIDVVLPPAPRAVPDPVELLPAVPAPAPQPETDELTWPCTACGRRNPFVLNVCGDCGSRFLQSASEEPSLVVPYVGDLRQLTRGQRIAVACGFVTLILLPLAVLTFLLTGSPSKHGTGNNGDVTITTTTNP